MKKMLLILSLVAISTAYSATNQLLKATLVIVDPASEVALNLTSTSLRFGEVGIVKGGNATTNTVTIKVTGNNVKGATVTFSDRGEVKLKGGAEVVPVKYLATNPTDGTVTTGGGLHTTKSTGNLGDGTAGKPMGVDISAVMVLTGKEKAGLYEGDVLVNAQYN